MTARPPIDLRCLTPHELKGIIRRLEGACNEQDAAAQKAQVSLIHLGLREEKLEAVVHACRQFSADWEKSWGDDPPSDGAMLAAVEGLDAWDKAHR